MPGFAIFCYYWCYHPRMPKSSCNVKFHNNKFCWVALNIHLSHLQSSVQRNVYSNPWPISKADFLTFLLLSSKFFFCPLWILIAWEVCKHFLSYCLYYFLDKHALHRILIVTSSIYLFYFCCVFWYIPKEATDLKDLALCFICRILSCLHLVLEPLLHIKLNFIMLNDIFLTGTVTAHTYRW